MAVIHIVLFKLKATMTSSQVKELCDDMLVLKTTCVHPTSNQPYIVGSSGGRDNSPEGMQHGLTHGFVVEFASLQDRDYYVNDDPTHKAFVEKHLPNIEDVRVIDYEKGVY